MPGLMIMLGKPEKAKRETGEVPDWASKMEPGAGLGSEEEENAEDDMSLASAEEALKAIKSGDSESFRDAIKALVKFAIDDAMDEEEDKPY